MKRMAWAGIGSIVVIAFAAPAIYADGITVAPFTFAAQGLGAFAPGGGPPAIARWENVSGDFRLFLAKNVDTAEVAAAGAQINGVSGLSTTGLIIRFTVEPTTPPGHCGAGAPRFNVRLQAVPGIVFLGCAHADVAGPVHSFTAGGTYGGVPFPEGQLIESISIVFDEGPASVFLDDIFVGGDSAGDPGHVGQ